MIICNENFNLFYIFLFVMLECFDSSDLLVVFFSFVNIDIIWRKNI